MKLNNNLIAFVLILSIVLSTVGLVDIIKQAILTGKATGALAQINVQVADYCGNDYKGSAESCDGTDLNSKTCITQGFASGTLSCTASCAFDTSSCIGVSAPSAAGGGGAGGGGGGTTITYDFDITPDIIKILLKLGEQFKKQIKIKNTGDTILSFQISTDLQDIISIDQPSFELRTGQEKTITLTFITLDNKKLGVNTGTITIKANSLQRQLPVIIEIESKKVLFDISLNIPAEYRQILPDSNLSADITILNLQDIKNAQVLLLYAVKDSFGKTILEENETLSIETQASFTKTFHIPNINPGTYILSAIAKYQDSIGTSSETFNVVEKITHVEKPLQLKKDYTLLLVILILIIANILYYQHYKLKHIERFQSKAIKNLYNEYRKKQTKEQLDISRQKLSKQLQLLEKAYKEKYIKEDIYNRCKQKIINTIKQLNKKVYK